MLNDLLVIGKIREGDVKAFENVFRSYYTPLRFYATGITGRMDIAEEIVQELFYVLWRDRKQLSIFRSLKSYLYGAVRNEALQYEQHKQVGERYIETVSKQEETDHSDPHDILEYNELNRLISNTLDKMPERRRKIFNMNRFEKKKYAEIASQLSISVKTVEAEMSKALHSLQARIEQYTKAI
jgi:RNA polymerase sigma-70 factor (ECF subfamily)